MAEPSPEPAPPKASGGKGKWVVLATVVVLAIAGGVTAGVLLIPKDAPVPQTNLGTVMPTF